MIGSPKTFAYHAAGRWVLWTWALCFLWVFSAIQAKAQALAPTGTPTFTPVLATPTPASATPTPPAATPTPTGSPAPVGLPGESEILDITNHANQSVTPGNSAPPPPPTGLKKTLQSDGLALDWAEAPLASGVTGYNVYRSQFPGAGYNLVNAQPVTAAHYLDGYESSLDPPKNGETYFYVVAAVDRAGNVSPYSEEVNAKVDGLVEPGKTPAAGEPTDKKKKGKDKDKDKKEDKVLDLPASNILNVKLPADSQLSIQGYKKIDTSFSHYTYNRPNGVGGISNKVSTNTVNQELVVNLDGKIGENVDVHVDFSDVNRTGGLTDSKQEISILYHGNPDSTIQEIAFGDLVLSIPNTEFAGFNKQLFGLQAKVKFDRLKLTSLFAQTKGITETKTFRGAYVPLDNVIQDVQYIRSKYFLITKIASGDTAAAALPKLGGKLEIWMDDGNPYNNTPNSIGLFDKLSPGIDYTLDYATGVITFLRPISQGFRLAVGYTRNDGAVVGLDGAGNIDLNSGLSVPPNGVMSTTPGSPHLILDNVDPTAVSPFYLVNYYDLGRDKIIEPSQDPDFYLEIVDQGSNIAVPITSHGARWDYKIDTDLNILTVTDKQNLVFPERPFANPNTALDSSNGTGTLDVYSQTTSPTSLFRIHIRYKTRVDFFKLDRLNILRGSESVFVDGRRMRRDVDYFFDYTSGILNFQDPTLLRPDSQVVVTYEYSPFGNAGQSNIFGARAEYDLTDHFFLGSTFLYNGTQTPQDVPQIGSTPNSMNLFDADARYELTRDMIHSATSFLPGLSKLKLPLESKFSAEIAKSQFNPDNYNMEGEKGVALVDNMEGIDDSISAGMSENQWTSSSAPLANNDISPALVPVVAQGPGNNRIRFRNNTDTFVMFNNTDGHLSDQAAVTNTVPVLQIPYANLRNDRWGGVWQSLSKTGIDASGVKYLQSWIKNDGVDKWVVLDFGTMSEDVNGIIPPGYSSAVNRNIVLGYDNVNDQSNPTQFIGDDEDGDRSSRNYDFGLQEFYFNYPNGVLAFPVQPFTDEADTQEGARNGRLDTKDMNGDNQVNNTNSYYSFGVRANWSGWRLVKIPVNFALSDGSYTTTDGLSYVFHGVGTAGLVAPIIRTVRVWMTGVSGSEVSGDIDLETLQLTKNRWEPRVDADAAANQGVSINPSKFDVSSVSRDQNPSYDASLRFIQVASGQDPNAILATEKSLQLTYNLSNGDFSQAGKPLFFSTRVFNQAFDFSDYADLKLDLEVRSFSPGEVLFIRLENDAQNYYQYNIPITSNSQNVWNPVGAKIDGSDNNRVALGRPYLNRVNQISIGVLSPNLPSGQTKVLWINNLRASGATTREGVAKRFNTTTTVGNNFATIATRYREVEGGFSQMDQTGTKFQLARQNGMDLTSNSIKVFQEPVNIQVSISRDDKLTTNDLKSQPFYLDLPETRQKTQTGSLSYSKTLPKSLGRLTNLRVSGSSTSEADSYLAGYLTQPGIQGNNVRANKTWTLASVYDAPKKLWFIPWGSNQLTQNYTFARDTQVFEFATIPDFDRSTRTQSYNWTNNSEYFKKLVFTPGYNWTLTEAKGNTTFAGQAGSVDHYIPFTKQIQPKAGLSFRGIKGVTPSVDYTGSNREDFSSSNGSRFNNANNVNYTLSLNPALWGKFFQKLNLTLDGGRSESSNSTIVNFDQKRALDFEEKWWLTPPDGIALNSTRSLTHRLNMGFKLLNVVDVRPTGSWSRQFNILSEGTPPTRSDNRTLGLDTSYQKKLFRVPYARFGVNSAEFQFTRTDTAQYDSSTPPLLDNANSTRTYALVFPYDINNKAQGNLRYQRTLGDTVTRDVYSHAHNNLIQLEYNQKFLQNKVIKIPFTKWKIKFQQAMELRITLLREILKTDSLYAPIQINSTRNRGTVEINYNALKNIRLGINFSLEHYVNIMFPEQGYDLVQGGISLEARF